MPGARDCLTTNRGAAFPLCPNGPGFRAVKKMNYKVYILMAATVVMASACQKQVKDDEVISQTYVHKYGYAVSQKEWQEKNYPGQVISSLRNGVTITATYENTELHGPCTFSYPSSHTIEKYILYNQNEPVKEITYDISGMPIQETVQLTQNRHSLTSWYSDGVPKSIEEYTKDELLEGRYFTPANELEARVDKGNGTRIIREISGQITCKDNIAEGLLVKRETFHSNGSPESIALYYKGNLHGKRTTFTPTGEPVAAEEWANGHLHGVSVYYKNGTKELEVSYLYGKKHGLETHFRDGDAIIHQISWEGGMKHGPETFFLTAGSKVLWNYDNKEVSKSRFDEMVHLDQILMQRE